MRSLVLSSLLLFAAIAPAAAGCIAAPIEEIESSESSINASMVRIDPVPLVLDGRERVVDYSPETRFFALEIRASAGDEIDIHVEARSPGGRAAVWLTDASFRNLVVSNDGMTTAHLHCVIAPAVAGKLYLVLRDANLAAGAFAVRGTGADPDEGGGCPGSCGDGGDAGGAATPLVCEPHRWRAPVPVAGKVAMAYRGKAWLFADDGKSWTAVAEESALTAPIPLPSGVTEMRDVLVEMAPSRRPLVTFSSNGVRHAAFWDGAAFVKTVALGHGREAHADASERIYAVTANGLTEFASGQEIVRGALPYSGIGWTVGADGTLHVLHSTSRPSTIHSGGTAKDLFVTSLPHGSMTWSADAKITSNEDWGYHAMPFAAAPDGSLHTAYALSSEAYYFRSNDGGKTWQSETFKDIVSKATLVDPARPVFEEEPERVKGGIRLLSAQDYDHASITMLYAQGSYSIPSFYFLRRCAPFSGLKQTWPAERLAFSGLAFDPGGVAVDERGLATIVTPSGARQDVPLTP